MYDSFFNKLNENLKQQNLKGTITTLNASMFELPFDDEHFDLIWSEGSKYRSIEVSKSRSHEATKARRLEGRVK